VHTRQSGVADHYATSDEHALAIARRIVANAHTRRPEPPWTRAAPEPPAVDPADLYGLIPDDHRTLMDAREVVARSSTGRGSTEFKAAVRRDARVRLGHIEGYPVGILANNGVLFAESAQKGAHFIELACTRRVPLVFLQNVTGFMSAKSTRRAASRATARSS